MPSSSHIPSAGSTADGAGRFAAALQIFLRRESAPEQKTEVPKRHNDTWTEEELVQLHCLLLKEIEVLAESNAPLDEALDVLRWVYTEPEKESKPFSFVNCVRVVERHLLSTLPFLGPVRPDSFRDLLRGYLRRWFPEMLKRYPEWVRDAVLQNPIWVSQRLEANPQLINQVLKHQRVQADLFA